MKTLYYVCFISCTLLFALSITLITSCSSSKADGSVTPGSASTASQLTNPNGYITAEINGKLLEIGNSIDQVQSFSSIGAYNIAGTKDTQYGPDSIKSIQIVFKAITPIIDVNTLKGVYKSGIDGTVSIRYNLETNNNLSYPNYKIFDQSWYTKENCTIEITSTTVPWIEGTFSSEGNLPYNTGDGPKTSITVKKGSFKVRYK